MSTNAAIASFYATDGVRSRLKNALLLAGLQAELFTAQKREQS